MIKFKVIYILALSGFLVSSCSNTKYLPQGEKLYIGAKVKVEDDSLHRKERKHSKKTCSLW